MIRKKIDNDAVVYDTKQRIVVDYFVKNFVKDPNTFITDISRNCQMYSNNDLANYGASCNAVFTYFDSALKMLYPLQILANWKFGGLSNCSSFLDFASGYGRLTRFLVQEMKPENITVSDILSDAVEFQKRVFGVDGFVSSTDPSLLKCDRRFDCIFVASLFTHLPEKSFNLWLEKLISILSPNGMLIFTVHDESLLTRYRPMSSSGIDYNPNVSEIKSLDKSEYGSTHVSHKFVSSAIKSASKGVGNYCRINRGLWHQDMYIYTPDGSAGKNPPNIGILGPQKIIGINDGRVVGWFLETNCNHCVSSVSLISSNGIRSTEENKDCFSFIGDGRFLPNNWQDPLYAVFDLVPWKIFTNNVYLQVISTSGEKRMFPVWSVDI